MNAWREWFGVELNEVSLTEKLISTLGGLISIGILFFLNRWGIQGVQNHFVVGSMGATAVLLFAVPHGQLSQPWPVIAGHGFSAAIGVLCAHWIPSQEVAAAAAVGLSIGTMHQLKCIHPPGGATALTAVIGGPMIQDLGFRFVLCPILINSLWMVGLAIVLNGAFRWRRYPARWGRSNRPKIITPALHAPSHEEIVRALKSLDSFVDITEDDLVRLCQILSQRKASEIPPDKQSDA